MVQVVRGRIRDTTTTTGTGAITLANAPPQGYRSFGSMMNVGDTIWAIIAAQTTGDWEEGLYTYSATNTLTRTTVYDNSLNTTALINFAAGTKDVYCVGPVAYTCFGADFPGGRLSNSSGVPVVTSNLGSSTGVYYSPYLNSVVPIYDGINWRMMDIGAGLSQLLTDTTKSPAAAVGGCVYDMFVWNDAGTMRCTRGPVWTSQTARAMALARVNGILTNGAAITNGPAINRGTYVGTISTNASAFVDWVFGSSNNTGAQQARFNVWNMYNRIDVAAMVQDSTANWTYALTAWHAANAQPLNSVILTCGQIEDAVSAEYQCLGQTNTTPPSFATVGIGVDSTTAQSGMSAGESLVAAAGGMFGTPHAMYSGLPGLGTHTVYAIENSPQAVTVTFYGAGGGGVPTGLRFKFKM